MSLRPMPEPPAYRITLFYGPEPVDASPSLIVCVFNVKKRSWKGGVQVAVEVDEALVAGAKRSLDFERWLETALAAVHDEDRPDYAGRAQELFVQSLCSLKLDLAIEAGLQQENSRLPAEVLAQALDRVVQTQGDRIRTYILSELDIATGQA